MYNKLSCLTTWLVLLRNLDKFDINILLLEGKCVPAPWLLLDLDSLPAPLS